MANKFSIQRDILFDERLSLGAKGLICMMMSLPPMVRFTVSGLSGDMPNSPEEIQKAMDELVAAEYVDCNKYTDYRIAENIYTVNWTVAR